MTDELVMELILCQNSADIIQLHTIYLVFSIQFSVQSLVFSFELQQTSVL